MTTAAARSPATMTARPSIPASLLAIGASLAVTVLLGIALVPIVVLALAGVTMVAGGMALRRRGYSMVGSGLALAGGAVGVAAVGLAGMQAGDTSELLWTVPGVLGVVLLGLAVTPLRGSGMRWLVKAGAGGLFVSVVLAGLFQAAPFGTLLVALAGTIVAWDAGEHAIDVGRQLGRSASTWRLDVSHVGATAAVGVVGVLAGHFITDLQAGDMSLASFLLLGVALVALTLALHR